MPGRCLGCIVERSEVLTECCSDLEGLYIHVLCACTGTFLRMVAYVCKLDLCLCLCSFSC